MTELCFLGGCKTVIVYRCQGMAENCGFCLELPDKYGCGWCHDQCDVQEKCSERNNEHMWLNKQQVGFEF